MEAEPGASNEDGAAREQPPSNAGFSNLPSKKPDVEMYEATTAPPNVDASRLAPSSTSPPTNRPALHNSAPMNNPVPARAHDAGPTDMSPPLGVVSRMPSAENKEAAVQSPSSSVSVIQAAGSTPRAAFSEPPQAAAAPRGHPPLPNPGSHIQSQQYPTLSHQAPANRVASISHTVPAVASSPVEAMPRIQSPINPWPRVPQISFPSNQNAAPMQNHNAHWNKSPPVGASPAPSEHTPFREPHSPTALNPYTLENIFTPEGGYLPDPSDCDIEPERYVQQCNQLFAVFRTMHPSVVRRIVRDTKETSLAGSEAHLSFIVSSNKKKKKKTQLSTFSR